MKEEREGQAPAPPPTPSPPPDSVGPNLSHHKARVHAVRWFPLGARRQESRPFAAPTPQKRNGAAPKAGLAHTPPLNMPSHPNCRPRRAVTRVVCPPGPPVYEDSCTAAWTSGPGGPRGREALGAPRGPSNRPPRQSGRQVQPRAAPPVPVQSGSADRPQSCVELGHPLPSAVVGDQRHVGRPGGGVSRPTTPPVGSVSGSPSLPTEAWSTRRHTSPHTQARRHLPPACATAGYGGGHQSGRP